MEVEFSYTISGVTPEQVEALEFQCARTATLNRHLTGYEVGDLVNGDLELLLRSGGHDRSAIVRRIVAPIRGIFARAKIPIASITLTGSRIMPNGRNLTLAEGRTPKGTFTDPSLRQMLADQGAKVEEL